MSTGKNIAKNTLLVFFARLLNSIFGFLTLIVLARYLSVEEYGKYIFVYTLISFTVLLADLGGFHIITREISRDKEKTKSIVGSAFTMRVLISTILLIIIVLITHFMIRDSLIKTGVYIVTIPQLIFAVNTISVAVFTANNRFGFDAMLQITSRSLELLSIIMIVIFNLGFLAIFIGIGASYLINAFLGLIVYLKNYGMPVFKYDYKYGKYLLYESLPVAITTFFSIAILRVDVFVLKILKGSADIALLNIPYTFIYTLSIIPLSFVSVIFPILCKLGDTEERSTFIIGYKKAFKFLYIISLLVSIILICFSNTILQFIYGIKFLVATDALKIMGVSIVFLFLHSLNTYSLISIKKQHLSTISTAIAFFLNLVLDLLLIPKYGYIGASIATSVSYCICFLVSYYFVLRNLGRLNLTLTLIKPIFGTVVTALFIVSFHNTNPFIILPISIIIYISSLIIIGVFSFEDIELVKSQLLPDRTRHIKN